MLAITRSISLLLLLLAASCGGDAREGGEGPCFAPGEVCGSGTCSQHGFCDTAQQCQIKRPDGSPCTEAKQCTGNRCESGTCAGGAVVCRADQALKRTQYTGGAIASVRPSAATSTPCR